MTETTEKEFEGYLMGVRLPSGQVRALEVLMFGGAAIVASRDAEAWLQGREHIWTFASVMKAVKAFHEWKDEPEPSGWIRHQPSARRRRYGAVASGITPVYQEWVEE